MSLAKPSEAGRVHHSTGWDRRGFLTAGFAAGLSLPGLLSLEAQAGIRNSRRAVINIHLDGGPPQMDLIDLKPDAPREIRGPYQPIATSIPGLRISDRLPRLAQQADDFVFIRSVVGAASAHNAFQCMSGFDEKSLASLGGRPALGCVAARLLGSPEDPSPAFVDLMQGRPLVRNSARPGFLGPAYKPFRPDLSREFQRELEPGMKNELAARGPNHTVELKLNPQLSLHRLQGRNRLLAGLDRMRRQVDSSGMMDAMDQFSQQATQILVSGEFAAAMDLAREDPQTVERFLSWSGSQAGKTVTCDQPNAALKLLYARRLIQAGVRVVTVSISDFDTHSGNFSRMDYLSPLLDHALTALVDDLKRHDLWDEVVVVAWGEFGRTPKVNANQGRDHWPRVGMALMTGGGIRTGQVIGATDRTASRAVRRPVSYQEILATLYAHLGIRADKTTLEDPTGRPQYLLDSGLPLPELI